LPHGDAFFHSSEGIPVGKCLWQAKPFTFIFSQMSLEKVSVSEFERKNFKLELLSKSDQKGILIPLLQSAQDYYGYIPESAIEYISEIVDIPPAEIYGVVTFYSQFRLKPLGKYVVRICEGTACHVNGAKNILRVLRNDLGIAVGETSDDGLFTLQSVACLGCCSLAPVIMVNDKTYGNLSPNKIQSIIKDIKTAL